MDFIAHIRKSDKAVQTVREHLLAVKTLAEQHGAKLGVPHMAGLAGLLHDLGKLTHAFRKYILDASANPDLAKRGSVDHATAGGKLLYELYHGTRSFHGMLAEMVGNAVISHHSYLQDFLGVDLSSDYLRRVRDKKDQGLDEFPDARRRFFESVMGEAEFQAYVDRAAEELQAFAARAQAERDESRIHFCLMFLMKFIFSALIDADRTDTRRFEEQADEPAVAETVDTQALFRAYYDRLTAHLAELESREDADSTINRLRRSMSEQCDRFAERPSGIYTLSIPTGGGKTLASLRYALKHALLYDKKRIVYVVPYTTIIEQNAEEVRKILQDDDHILEHHSNVVDDDRDDDEAQDGIPTDGQKWKLVRDTWDVPILFTTMVQFLNVFYAKGTRNVRRLHQLCESVVIFDEVQKVPVHCVSLFNEALNFLKTFGRSSIILCTATQPALDYVEHKLAINTDAEMVRDLGQVAEAFKRVEIVDLTLEEPYTTEKLCAFIAAKLQEVRSILVILNTKTVVRRLYERLKQAGLGVPVIHLSTSMCAEHRQDRLRTIRQRLERNEPVVCVSTQLIEAGVDVSFPCVIRSLAGLDSIAQAAGRCNRHGEWGIQHVYVVDHAEENLERLPEIRAGKQAAKRILIDLRREPSAHGGNILSAQAMERYFQELYARFRTDLDYHVRSLNRSMVELLAPPRRLIGDAYRSRHGEPLPLYLTNSCHTAAEHFQVITDRTTSVLVPYGRGLQLIAAFNGAGTIGDLGRKLREAQRYVVNLYDHEKRRLEESGGLVPLLDGRVLAVREGAYHAEYGLDTEQEGPLGFLDF